MDTKIAKTNARMPIYIRYFESRGGVINPVLNDHEQFVSTIQGFTKNVALFGRNL